jgi:hypothetical protein
MSTTNNRRAIACIRLIRRWFIRQIPPKQFVVKLAPHDGQYHNFFAHGSFEQLLKRARLIERFNLGQDHCVLLFEELPDTLNNHEQKP